MQINEHRDQVKEEAAKERELLKQRVLSDQKVDSLKL